MYYSSKKVWLAGGGLLIFEPASYVSQNQTWLTVTHQMLWNKIMTRWITRLCHEHVMTTGAWRYLLLGNWVSFHYIIMYNGSVMFTQKAPSACSLSPNSLLCKSLTNERRGDFPQENLFKTMSSWRSCTVVKGLVEKYTHSPIMCLSIVTSWYRHTEAMMHLNAADCWKAPAGGWRAVGLFVLNMAAGWQTFSCCS